ncbi:hypothetical protein EYF80_030065 [Liparis tanakae]|uniref:Uncharacterized protein n=1 Tax=Liparis tanakae TaxID=230148 RepID=A0A4Z2H4E8_9TELE|nr:hypothetical protein EYF80_030065 [Liparis tanakae]
MCAGANYVHSPPPEAPSPSWDERRRVTERTSRLDPTVIREKVDTLESHRGERGATDRTSSP